MNCVGVSASLSIIPVWNLPFRNIRRFLKSSGNRNPYDVLGLKNNSSTKDVKKAYIKLCKELHPDMKPGDKSQHKKFIELNDAYNTLLNPDYKKSQSERQSEPNYSQKSHGPEGYTSQNWESERAWHEQEEYQEYIRQRDKSDHIKPENRIANVWILAGCFILVVVGSLLYISAYSYATSYTTEKVNERSRKISENYTDVRRNALEKGKVEQLDNLKKRWTN